jgi:dTMP kinase
LASRGFFITVEGIDGTGKSTQCRRLERFLRQSGYSVCATREPGGTAVGEQVRSILLGRNRRLAPLAELVLMYAARAQHLEEIIRPALARGEVVVSDRFNDASFAYQGYGRGLGEPLVRQLDRAICGATQPDLTVVLDLDPALALGRALGRDRKAKSASSRFEAAGLEFQQRVRTGYRARARRCPRRVVLIAADRSLKEIEVEVWRVVQQRLAGAGRRF